MTTTTTMMMISLFCRRKACHLVKYTRLEKYVAATFKVTSSNRLAISRFITCYRLTSFSFSISQSLTGLRLTHQSSAFTVNAGQLYYQLICCLCYRCLYPTALPARCVHQCSEGNSSVGAHLLENSRILPASFSLFQLDSFSGVL
jgi:hypothetical protein